MTIEFLDQWIAALRSGAFTETKGSLRIVKDGKGECFCALGVGVELILDKYPRLTKHGRIGYDFRCNDDTKLAVSSMVPILDESGFVDSNEDYDLALKVAEYNDLHHTNFNDVALMLDVVVRKQLLDREARRGEKTKEEV